MYVCTSSTKPVTELNPADDDVHDEQRYKQIEIPDSLLLYYRCTPQLFAALALPIDALLPCGVDKKVPPPVEGRKSTKKEEGTVIIEKHKSKTTRDGPLTKQPGRNGLASTQESYYTKDGSRGYKDAKPALSRVHRRCCPCPSPRRSFRRWGWPELQQLPGRPAAAAPWPAAPTRSRCARGCRRRHPLGEHRLRPEGYSRGPAEQPRYAGVGADVDAYADARLLSAHSKHTFQSSCNGERWSILDDDRDLQIDAAIAPGKVLLRGTTNLLIKLTRGG